MQFKPTLRRATELGIALTAVSTLILAGCGGGGGGGSASSGGAATAATTTTVTPFKGRFQSGQVKLKDANGSTVTLQNGSGSINASGVASVTFNQSVSYPLTIEVAGTYIDEVTGASAVMDASSPLLGMIPAASDAAATSGVPVTAVTHMARQNFGSNYGFTPASAVAAITAVASNVLGVSNYADAMKPPVFNPVDGKTADERTIQLMAMAKEISTKGTGTSLHAKLQDISNKLAAGSAVDAVFNAASMRTAFNDFTSGASSVVPATATTPQNRLPITLPTGNLNSMIAGAIPSCTGTQVLTPTSSGLQCVAASNTGGTGGTTGSACVDRYGSGLRLIDVNGVVVTGMFTRPTISAGSQLTLHLATLANPSTSSYSVSFDTATTPVTVQPSEVNLTTSTLTVTVPSGATGGIKVKDTCTRDEAYQTGLFQIAQAAGGTGGLTLTLTRLIGSNSFLVDTNTATGAVFYQLQCGTTSGINVTSILSGATTTTPIFASAWSSFSNFDVGIASGATRSSTYPLPNTTYYCKVGAFSGQLYVSSGLSLIAQSAEVSVTTASVDFVVDGGLTWMPITYTDTWANADAYCTNTTINGLTGWRLPTATELLAAQASKAIRGQAPNAGYPRVWSSTYYGKNGLGNLYNWVSVDAVSPANYDIVTNKYYVTCVR